MILCKCNLALAVWLDNQKWQITRADGRGGSFRKIQKTLLSNRHEKKKA